MRWQWAARAWAASLQYARASSACHAPSGFCPFIWCSCSSRLVKTQEIISSFHKLLCRKSLQSNGRTHTPTHRDTHIHIAHTDTHIAHTHTHNAHAFAGRASEKSSASVGPTSRQHISCPFSFLFPLPLFLLVLEPVSAWFVDKLLP